MPAGPTLILCDGIACDGFAWEHIAPELAQRFRLLHNHHRGHGRSGLPRREADVTVPFLARDIVELMDIEGIESATFVGHSMGCQVLLEVAWRYPERFRGGVLINGAHGRPLDTFRNTDLGFRLLPAIRQVTSKYGKHLAPALRFLVPSRLGYEFAAFSEINRSRTTHGDLTRYLEHLARMPQDSFLATLEDAAERISEHFHHAIDAPMLIIAGDADGFTPPATSASLRAALPCVEYELLPGGTHISPVEFPAEIVARIECFLHTHALDTPVLPAPPAPLAWGDLWRDSARHRAAQ